MGCLRSMLCTWAQLTAHPKSSVHSATVSKHTTTRIRLAPLLPDVAPGGQRFIRMICMANAVLLTCTWCSPVLLNELEEARHGALLQRLCKQEPACTNNRQQRHKSVAHPLHRHKPLTALLSHGNWFQMQQLCCNQLRPLAQVQSAL